MGSASAARYVCPAGVGGRPRVPCALGRAGACPWGIGSMPDLHCAWEFVRRHPAGATLAEVGRVMGLTRERVRQIEKAALERLAARDVSEAA